jgi:ferric-dicitrate binding protein FerR (iron transport regulator)
MLAALSILGIGVGTREIQRAREAASIASARRISIVAPKGRVESVRLPDGTRVALAPTSLLWYSATFGRTEREVHLEGEAHFAVAHDSSKTFTVFARNGVARDIGTEFTVRAYADDPEVSIVVAEGRVAVGTGRPASIKTSSAVLGPGDAWRLARDGQAHVERADVARATAWMRGVLAFDGTPLAEVRVELSRWFDVRLEFTDESLASRRLTGTFTSASVAELLAAIGPALNVRYEIHGNRILLSPVPRRVRRAAPDDSR